MLAVLLWPSLAPAAGGGASAHGGGAAPPASTSPSPLDAVRPSAAAVICRTRCTEVGVKPGGWMRITGTKLNRVRWVVFLGGSGAGDNVTVRARHQRSTRLDFVVPSGAPSGRVRMVTRSGVMSRASNAAQLIVDISAGLTDGPLPPVNLPALTAQVQARRVFYASATPAAMNFVLRGAVAQDVRVDVVSVATGRSAISKVLYAVPPGVPQAVTWSGAAATGLAAPDGNYQFRIAVGPQPRAATPAARAASVPPNAANAGAFLLLNNEFPVRGRHNYGGSQDRFGAARAGHTHQGQDVMAACDTRIVAARGGTVIWRAFEAAAGNYVVVQTDGSGGQSNAYMHLRDAALVEKGQHVTTGQLLGYIGETGDAVGCHLHFEQWTSPGWYQGGHPVDPLAELRAWDATS